MLLKVHSFWRRKRIFSLNQNLAQPWHLVVAFDVVVLQGSPIEHFSPTPHQSVSQSSRDENLIDELLWPPPNRSELYVHRAFFRGAVGGWSWGSSLTNHRIGFFPVHLPMAWNDAVMIIFTALHHIRWIILQSSAINFSLRSSEITKIINSNKCSRKEIARFHCEAALSHLECIYHRELFENELSNQSPLRLRKDCAVWLHSCLPMCHRLNHSGLLSLFIILSCGA